MKTLVLVRHAKADHGDSSLDDFDRPLNYRGKRDASAMAVQFKKTGVRVDALISSPAVRALSTAEDFAMEINLAIQTDERIYEASLRDLLAVVRELDDRHSSVMLAGHNPGMSELLHYLTGASCVNLPTAAVVVIELPQESWQNIPVGKGVLKSLSSPKE
jgi:phosphohistidine phosphatase